MQEDHKAEGERRAKAARTALYMTMAGLAINIVGASVFWLSLPERLRNVTEELANHKLQIRALEIQTGEHGATLGRIDERTKSIQENLVDIRQRLSEHH